MAKLLLSIQPNDLETILIDAETVQAVFDDQEIQDKIQFDKAVEQLEEILQDFQPAHKDLFKKAIFGEYPFPHISAQLGEAQFNAVVVVTEIAQVLDEIELSVLKRYLEKSVYEKSKLAHHLELHSEQKISQLLETFKQLQRFYAQARQKNQSVIVLSGS